MRPDGLADPLFFRTIPALDDAGRELRDLARVFGAAGDSTVTRGAAATESWVRTSTAVSEARVLVFATHGLIAGEFARGSEPALVLTPPDDPSQEDDGLLTASEIATLSLSSDWVILSACNTAAGRSARAEGLSGLARAFAHAGARSLMVSHWYVPSQAAASLSVFAAEGATRRGLDRARALREAMLRVMNGEDADGRSAPRHAHPVYWAPFVMVGAVR
jgi:CHAT domain-containing protein